jgi:predicted nucleotidyltransferase
MMNDTDQYAIQKMNNSMDLNEYRASRVALLAEITQTLSNDERFLAAWLTGSYGRNDEDEVSDLDLTVVVSDSHGDSLCKRFKQTSPQTSEERLELFRLFGTPAVIHENNHNAPEGGTFTFVLYTPSALMVDWTLIPHSQAHRPPQSCLLFDKAVIPVRPRAEPESLEQRIEKAAEIIAFFWMMSAVTAKYLIRKDHVFVTYWLEELNRMVREVERLIAGKTLRYGRGSLSVFEPTSEGQKRAIYQLCERMEKRMPELAKMGGHVLPSPTQAIETLLDLAK